MTLSRKQVLTFSFGLLLSSVTLPGLACSKCLPAKQSFTAKKYKEAASLFKSAAKANPNCIDARLGEAEALGLSNNHPAAIKALTAIIAAQPKLAKAYVLRGIEYENRKEPNKVVREANSALAINPRMAEAYALRARGYYMLVFTCFGQDKDLTRKGLADLDKAIELDPKLAVAHYNKGVWLFGEKKSKEAIVCLTRAIELAPAEYTYYNYRAIAYEETGQVDKAIEDLSVFIKLNPKEINGYRRRANAYIQKGDCKKALEDLNHAIAIAPRDFKLKRNRGELLMKLKRFKEAIADFDLIAKANSMDDEAFKSMGDAYFELGNYPLSLQNYNEAIGLRDDSQTNYMARSRVYKKLGKNAQAQLDIQKAKSCLGTPES
ncbi:MAG: tetratricopeptide repeat protein [Candidatus Melainabacteria bacterium]|nr:tetratricopeptide repeat protein [Candidatus Melainabacteria bacterium]